MDAEGTAAKALVCEACWNGLFSFDAWHTVLAATQQPGRIGYSKGYCYITTWEAIHASASAGCNWCQFLARPKRIKGELEVWVAYDEASECTPAGTKKLTVKTEGSGAFSFQHYYMYTDSSTWVLFLCCQCFDVDR
jgi:hypothetical protein